MQMDWERYQNIKDQLIEQMAENMSLYGISPSAGRLFGILYFADKPMTLDDMCQELGMSKTSMSLSIRSLYEMRMVRTVFHPNARKHLYQVEGDWYKSFVALFARQWRKATESNLEEAKEAQKQCNAINDQMADGHNEHTQRDIELLEKAQYYYEWLLRLVGVIESGQIFNIIPKNHAKDHAKNRGESGKTMGN